MVCTLNSVSFATQYLENETQFFCSWCWGVMPYRIHLQIWLLNPVYKWHVVLIIIHFTIYSCDYISVSSLQVKSMTSIFTMKKLPFLFHSTFISFWKMKSLCYTPLVKRIYTLEPFKRNDHFQVFHEVSGSASHLYFQIPNSFAALCAIQ